VVLARRLCVTLPPKYAFIPMPLQEWLSAALPKGE